MSATRTGDRNTGGKAMRSPWALMLVVLSMFGMLFLSGIHERHPDTPAAAHVHANHGFDDTGEEDTAAGDQLAGHGAMHGETMPTQSELAFSMPAVPSTWHGSVIGLRPSGDPSGMLRPPRG